MLSFDVHNLRVIAILPPIGPQVYLIARLSDEGGDRW